MGALVVGLAGLKSKPNMGVSVCRGYPFRGFKEPKQSHRVWDQLHGGATGGGSPTATWLKSGARNKQLDPEYPESMRGKGGETHSAFRLAGFYETLA